ncbi:MAG: hypothetical protein ABJA02_08345 [Acidobacteriota bacterium]
MKFLRHRYLSLLLLTLAMASAGCLSVKQAGNTPRLLKTESASQSDLMKEVNRYARVNSMRAKMYLKFEDNSFAEFGSKEVYRSADGEIVVQRPASILLKVQVPVLKTDVAQMTSDGKTFRVAILQDGGSGKYKKFVKGTNSADYSKLQKELKSTDLENAKALKEGVSAFANLRPQHFTDAMLVRPTDAADIYTRSTIFQTEEDPNQPKKSPLRNVMRGYYLLDEFAKADDGTLTIQRRFWFDRVGGIRLARQQIFDTKGEIESDIVYGKEGQLTDSPDYANLPLEIQVTRPKEKYSMKLTYQTPENVAIGETYKESAFLLKNTWNLEEVDLDERLRSATAAQATPEAKPSATRFQ